MKIIVLGANGFIGSNLCRCFAAKHQVVSVSRSRGSDVIHPNIEHYQSTLDNTDTIQRIISEGDVVIHTASDTTPGTSTYQPSLEALNNITPTLRLLECLHNRKNILLVYFSSGGAVYDKAAPLPYKESSPIAPRSYYGAAKLSVESFIHAHLNQSNNRTVILRPSNVYGPSQLAKRSFGIVPTILDAIEHGQPFNIWGDGSIIRDYLYIDDLVQLCQSMVARKSALDEFSVFNAGFGKGYSILELCDMTEEITGLQLKRVFQSAREVDMPHVVLDHSTAREILGWNPSVDLDTGIKKVWQARQNNI